jgi:hypothetical protein
MDPDDTFVSTLNISIYLYTVPSHISYRHPHPFSTPYPRCDNNGPSASSSAAITIHPPPDTNGQTLLHLTPDQSLQPIPLNRLLSSVLSPSVQPPYLHNQPDSLRQGRAVRN